MRQILPILGLLASCAPPLPGERANSDERIPWGYVLGGRGLASPDAPALLSDVHLTDEDLQGALSLSHPVYPSLRSSADGRIGVNVRPREAQIELYLVGPEGLTEPLAQAAPGVHMYLDRMLLEPTEFFTPLADETLRHVTLCDATTAANPYSCLNAPDNDCYDLTMVSSVNVANTLTQLWGTDLTIEVANPKTASATLATITAQAPVPSVEFDLQSILEPTVAGDGHLLVARSDWTLFQVPDPANPGLWIPRSANMVYAVPEDPTQFEPCDVGQWTTWQPLSHMHTDPAAAGYGYGLAAYPFRDPEFNEIPDNDALGLSYPWIDRNGDNLFFTSSRATLFYDADTDPAAYDIQSRYPWDCVAGQSCGVPLNDVYLDPDGITAYEDISVTRGVGVAGLWTRGKMVVLDGLLNNTDYGFGREAINHRMLALYAPGTGPNPNEMSGFVRAGTGRDNESYEPSPEGTTNNTAVIDSFRNVFFHHDAARPTTQRDVIWTVNTGKVSAEVAFDDYLDPDALLVAEMTASFSHTEPGTRNATTVHDGFSRDPLIGDRGFFEPVHFQNAAAPDLNRWQPPTYGLGFHGVRVEPVALGGRQGRGVWLFGEGDGVVFPLLDQPNTDVLTSDWYTSLFLDPRFENDSVVREVLVFPDGSGFSLRGQEALVVYGVGGVIELDVLLPNGGLVQDGWNHIGLNLVEQGTQLKVYIDGFLWAEHTMNGAGLQPVEGRLWLGGKPRHEDGFRGWLDELKIIARDMSPELACNHARGTLVQIERSADAGWVARAESYPQPSHDLIGGSIGAPSDAIFACFSDTSVPITTADNAVPLPPGMVPIRDALLFPEGPLVHGEPRPDSSANPFCLSCHTPGNTPTLGLDSLDVDRSLSLSDDSRRQPMQPPVRVFGNVPIDYAGLGLPAASPAPVETGMILDQWTFAP